MNVIFHVMAGISAGGLAIRVIDKPNASRSSYVIACVSLMIAGVMSHGILDIAPHHYPLRATPDIIVSSLSIFLILALVRLRWVILVGASIFGSILPDLIDLGPSMLHEICGVDLRFTHGKVFFWHEPAFSGSIYDGTRATESFIYHAVVVLAAIGVMRATATVILRENLLRLMTLRK